MVASFWQNKLSNIKPIFFVFLLALAVRFLLLAFLYDANYVSGMAQGELARNIAQGRGFVTNINFQNNIGHLQNKEVRLIDIEEALKLFPPDDRPENFRPFIAYQMPGQGILLAATYKMFGSYRYIYLQVLQALLDALGVLLLYRICLFLFNDRVALFACVLYAIYIPEARLAISATRDAWMPIIYLTSAYLFIAGWKHQRPLFYFLGGCAVAFGMYFRSEILLFSFFFGMVLLLTGEPWKGIAKLVLLSIIPIVLLLTPWTLRNYEVFHRIIPTNTGLWFAVWQSFGEHENDFGAVNNDGYTHEQAMKEGYRGESETPEFDDLFKERVVRVVTERPLWLTWTMFRRLARVPFQMHSWGLTATDEIHWGTAAYHTGAVNSEGYLRYLLADPHRFMIHVITRGINFLLFLSVGLWWFLAKKKNWKEALWLLAFPAYNILIHAVLGMNARYIAPTNALLLPFVVLLVLYFLDNSKKTERS